MLPNDRLGSNFVMEVMSAARPLFHRKRKSVQYGRTAAEIAFVREAYADYRSAVNCRSTGFVARTHITAQN
jgi:hypothetical protein